LAKALDKAELVEQACDELIDLAADRKRWLVYGVTVKHATHIADALKARGVACGVIHAQTPAGERDALLKMLHRGQMRALVNVATLTTGIDIPELDCIAMMRNTKSPVLYTQIAGRGMRTAPGKENCLWCDFTDTTAILGPVDAIKGRARPRSRKEEREAPTRVCPECGSINATGRRTCIDCGHEFPEPERIKHDARVNGAAVMSGNSRVKSHDITEVQYAEHRKEGKPTSLRVEYWVHLRKVASEWLCFEHEGYARGKARWTWREMGGEDPVPETVEEAMSRTDELKRITRVHVDTSGEFWEVVGREYAGTEDSLEDLSGCAGPTAGEEVRDVLPFSQPARV
jgi:DNA repair protein RadD